MRAALRRYWIAPFVEERVVHYTVPSPHFLDAPLRVAVLSDLHAGLPFVPLTRVARCVDTVLAQGADLVLLPGDFFSEEKGLMRPLPHAPVAAELARLDAPLGVYAVLGNHDWKDDPAAQARGAGPVQIAEALRAVGIDVLQNETRCLAHAGVDFDLAGVDSQRAFWTAPRDASDCLGADDLEQTLAAVSPDRFCVLMAHEPDIFPSVARHAKAVDLTISGHTHAGQIQCFGTPLIVPSRYGARYAHGHITENERDLIVSAGIGCSGLPLRFGAMPEIVVIEIGGPAGAS